MLRAAAAHRGTALVEIFQDCPIFNDGSFDVLRSGDEAAERLIPLTHGEPIRFGPVDEDGLGTSRWSRRASGCGWPRPTRSTPSEIVVHDATDHNLAFALSRLSRPGPHAHRHRGVPQRRPG